MPLPNMTRTNRLHVCARSHLNVWISLSSLERTNTERKRRILQQWSAFIFITRSGISPEYESDHFSGLVSILEWTGKSNGSLRWRSGDSIRSPSWFIHPVFATLWFSFRFFAILTFSELWLTNYLQSWRKCELTWSRKSILFLSMEKTECCFIMVVQHASSFIVDHHNAS